MYLFSYILLIGTSYFLPPGESGTW